MVVLANATDLQSCTIEYAICVCTVVDCCENRSSVIGSCHKSWEVILGNIADN